ncbi:MAG TPA: quinolinate synthase NadA [Patescibacteria group bacterium]|nr:quinolinate synthase NadA [Patescibacteria group bacterium]
MLTTLENPEIAIDYIAEIVRLKKEMNAVILAHYYQVPEIQDLADFVGDSLELSRKAKETDADVIVFCGVHFMAETAKIFNPDKQVLLPDLDAGCSLADSCPGPLFKEFREKYPDHYSVTYINCTADVKALSDVIITSSSAEKILRNIPADKPILFAPDRNLGAYFAKKLGREMLLWQGDCIVHVAFSERRIEQLMIEHPNAVLIAHPECEEHILKRAEYIGSTSALLTYTETSPHMSFIVATEEGILHQMKKRSPNKEFIPAPPEDKGCMCNQCPYMRLNTLEKLYSCMKNRTPEIILPQDIIDKALVPLNRMLEWTKVD